MPNITVKAEKTIRANKGVLMDVVSDLSRYHEYDPWKLVEPECTYTLSDETKGVGAKYEWKGKLVGSGQMEIVNVSVDEGRIDIALQFFAPMKQKAQAYWLFEEKTDEEGQVICHVTWGFTASLPWFMGLFKGVIQRGIEENVVPSYHVGLIRLAHVVDKEAPSFNIEYKGYEEYNLAYMGVPFQDEKMGTEEYKHLYKESYPKIEEYIKEKSWTSHHILTLFTKIQHREKTGSGVIAKEIDKPKYVPKEFVTNVLAHKVYYKSVYKGPFEYLIYAWGICQTKARVFQNKKNTKQPFFEIYIHHDEDPSKNEMHLYIPVDTYKKNITP